MIIFSAMTFQQISILLPRICHKINRRPFHFSRVSFRAKLLKCDHPAVRHGHVKVPSSHLGIHQRIVQLLNLKETKLFRSCSRSKALHELRYLRCAGCLRVPARPERSLPVLIARVGVAVVRPRGHDQLGGGLVLWQEVVRVPH